MTLQQALHERDAQGIFAQIREALTVGPGLDTVQHGPSIREGVCLRTSLRRAIKTMNTCLARHSPHPPHFHSVKDARRRA